MKLPSIKLDFALKLTSFILAVSVLPLLLFELVSYSSTRQAILQEAVKNNMQLLSNQRDYLNLQMEQIDGLAKNLGSVDEIIQTLSTSGSERHSQSAYDSLATKARIGYVLSGYSNLRGLVSIDLFTLNGKQFHVGDTLDVAEVNATLRDRLIHDTTSTKSALVWYGVDDNVNAASSSRKVVVATKALSRENSAHKELAGMLLINFSTDYLHDHFSKINLGEGAYLMIIDAQGRLIYHPNKNLIGEPIENSLKTLLLGGSGSLQVRLDGRNVLLDYIQIPEKGWHVLSVVPNDTLMAPMKSIERIGIAILIFNLVLISLFVRAYLRKVVLPIRAISEGFKRFQANQLEEKWRLPDQNTMAEINDLVNWFNSFLESIETNRQAQISLRIAATAFESHEGMVITDAHSVILKVNHAFTTITGYSADEVIGKKPSMLSSGRQDASFYSAMWASINGTGSWEGEIWNRRKNGEIYPEHLTITAVKDKNGNVTNYVGALTDSTLRQQALEQLSSTARELELANAQVEEERARLVDRVEERTSQLQMANHAKDSFLATMSHEIRTPLGGLLGMMELLDLSHLDAKQHELLEAARKSGKSLLRIVNDILDWSKIEAGKLELAPRAASIAEMLKGVASTYAQIAFVKDIQLKIKVDPELSTVHLFDLLRLSQILNNFTSNALKFTQQGTIEISAQRHAYRGGYETVRFSVKDSGAGISKEQQSRLFQHYEQASADTARMYGGTGLGLSICRRLAELMDGTLRVESTPGVGSTFSFTVSLPVADVAALQDMSQSMGRMEKLTVQSERHEGETDISSLVVNGQHYTILIVDDHPLNRMLLKQQLDLLGLQVEAAESGTPALALWQSGHFDLIITDCHMPEMDGYELTRRIREIERHSGARRVPIIAWTANVLAEEEVRCREAGMDDILTKPTELADLRTKLVKWLDKVAVSVDDTAQVTTQRSAASRPVINFSVLKKFVASHAAQVEMLQVFKVQNRMDIAALHATLQEHDPVAVAQAAHRIKGACRMVGANELEALSIRIEQAAKQGDMHGARAAAEMLDGAVERIEDAVAGFVG